MESGFELRPFDSRLPTPPCVVRKRGEVAESSSHETAWLLWNTPFTFMNTSRIFLFLLLPYFKMFISVISVFWSPLVPSKPRGLVPSWVKMSVSSPLLELNFSPLKVSFTEFFPLESFIHWIFSCPCVFFFTGILPQWLRLPAMQDTLVWSLGWEDSLKKRMVTHSSILGWRIPWTESLADYSPQGRKESDVTD